MCKIPLCTLSKSWYETPSSQKSCLTNVDAFKSINNLVLQVLYFIYGVKILFNWWQLTSNPWSNDCIIQGVSNWSVVVMFLVTCSAICSANFCTRDSRHFRKFWSLPCRPCPTTLLGMLVHYVMFRRNFKNYQIINQIKCTTLIHKPL